MPNLELDIWRGEWGLASIDLECLKVLTYMKFIGVPVKVREVSNPFFTPKGCLPVLRDGRAVFSTFEEVVEYLKSLHFSTNFYLDGKKAAEATAFSQYLREKLLPAVQFAWWVDEKNYAEVTRPTYAKALTVPLNFYYPQKYQSEAIQMMEVFYGEFYEFKEVEKAVYADAEKCLQTISDRLGESEYFFGSQPSSFDAVAFAYLAPLVKAPFPNSTLSDMVKDLPNLTKFVARINQKNFKHVTDEYLKQNAKSMASQSEKSKSFFTESTRNKVFAGLFALVVMTGFAFANGFIRVNMSEEDAYNDYDMYNNEEEDDD